MQKTKILLGVIITLVITYFGLIVFQQDAVADYIRPAILPLVVVHYCLSGHNERSNFFLFLLFYAIAELLGVFYYYSSKSKVVEDVMYFGGNILYIIAYIFLIIEVLKSMDVAKIFNKFAVHLVILIILDIYCVILVTDVAIKSEALTSIYDYILEFVYNIVIMALLTITLVNYLHRDSKKAMNLLLGTLCIVFSEVIQVAYYYVSEIMILSIAYNVLLILAFCFFYIQIVMIHEVPKSFEQPANKVEA